MSEEIARMRPATSDQRPAHNYSQKLPVRIAHIVGKAHNGGVEAVVMNYYRNIDRTKIQYDFILDEDSSDQHFISAIEALGGKAIIIPPYQKPFAYHKALFKLFTEKKYPIVYSHLNTLSVFPLFAAWRAGIPIRIAHSHSTAGKGEFKRNVMKYILRNFSRVFPTKLCACSRFAGEFQFGKKALRDGKVIIWPNAIDIERFAYNETVRHEVRQTLNLAGKFVVGHAGRFVKTKNHSFLIDIFAEIRRQREDAVLLLAGNGPLMDDVRAKVAGLELSECVVFLGSVNDIVKFRCQDCLFFSQIKLLQKRNSATTCTSCR